jgi:hypothetical protein
MVMLKVVTFVLVQDYRRRRADNSLKVHDSPLAMNVVPSSDPEFQIIIVKINTVQLFVKT